MTTRDDKDPDGEAAPDTPAKDAAAANEPGQAATTEEALRADAEEPKPEAAHELDESAANEPDQPGTNEEVLRADAEEPAPPAQPERSRDWMPMLAAGAVLFGVAVVAGIWWSDRGSTEDEVSSTDTADLAGPNDVEDPLTAAPEQSSADPFGQGSRPQPPAAPADVAAPPEDAEHSESGLAWRVLEEGSGSEHPAEDDIVTLEYTGWTTEGQVVDSTEMRGEPAKLPLDRAVDGWVEGVQLMVTGEKRRFWVPAELADTGRGPPPGTIVFDMKLVDFRPAPEPPPTPRDVAAPPADAERTESGLASKVLEQGEGQAHPAPTNRVRVHFTGWTADGEMFDTSTALGEPATLPPLERIVPGMREGLEMMVVGEKRRLWIPEELAFSGQPGAPEGMVVFDLELVEIMEPRPMRMPGLPGQPRMPPAGAGGSPPQGHPPVPPSGAAPH